MYKIVSFLHKLLGTLLCILFFMWFCSGIVMIYHSFPRASAEKQLAVMPALGNDLPAPEIVAGLPDSFLKSGLSLSTLVDEPVFKSSGREPEILSAASLAPVEITTEKTLASWCTAPVKRIDTLQKLDQWIPFGRNKEELPIYRYHFDDPEQHQLYIGSKTGKVLQFTSRKERVWSWFGAIPHWVYFTRLRQEQKLWIEFVKWAAGIGCIMCLLGFVVAIRVARKSKNKVKPYKKKIYNWHYITGFVFGLFAIAFAFSGMMSLTDMPEFLKKAPKKERLEERGRPPRGFGRESAPLKLDSYTLDYRTALAAYPETKIIKWNDYKGVPYYELVSSPDEKVLLDASASEPVQFRISEEMVEKQMRKLYADSLAYTIELIDSFDSDYHLRKVKETSLPVYRVIVDDYMHTRHYINPVTLDERRVDDDSRTRGWLYHKLHTLDFKFLTDRPWLWFIVMYTLMIGGTALSVTGVVLGIRWLVRGIRKLFRKNNNQ